MALNYNKTDLKLFDNSFYKPGNRFKILFWFLCNRLFVNTYLPIPVFLKIMVLRIFGAKIGNNVLIKPKVNIKYPWFLIVSNNVWIGEKVWIDNLAQVNIGKNVCISQGAMLLCGNHNYKKPTFDLMVGEINLADGVWIGAKAVVCPGVSLKSHAILSVNSVATKNLDEYSIYQGNPAIKVRERIIK